MNQLQNTAARRSLLSLGLPKHIIASLIQNGYEAVQDLRSVTAMSLSPDKNAELFIEIGITMSEAEDVMARCGASNTPALSASMTQHVAASILQHSQKLSTRCKPLDQILEGGLSRGQVIDISGPPGSPRERIVKGIVSSYAEDGQETIFLDCQNMVSVSSLTEALKNEALDLVHYTTAHTLPDLLIFMQQLPRILKQYPKTSLLVLNSISFPFQSANTGAHQRNSHLSLVKQCLAKATALHKLSVVITTQLATKMVNADGTTGNFETGARGIMMPSLGSGYVPNSKTYRVILAPEGLRSGSVRLTSSPKHPENEYQISAAYSLDSLDMSAVATP